MPLCKHSPHNHGLIETLRKQTPIVIGQMTDDNQPRSKFLCTSEKKYTKLSTTRSQGRVKILERGLSLFHRLSLILYVMDESVENEHGIIEELYALVSAPDQYDRFMLSLQKKLDALPMRGEEDADRKALIGGHMQRASALIDIVTPWRRDADTALHGLLSMKMQAMLAVDGKGRIVDANDAAKVIYTLTPESGLADLPLDTEDMERLFHLVKETVLHSANRNAPNNVLRLRNRDSGGSLLVTVEPHISKTTEETYAILKTSDIGWPSHLGPILQDLFDLTRAEVEIVRMMVEGDRVLDIARRRCSAVKTVRSQLSAIFAKTDTTSQMECVRMVFGLSLMHEMDEGQLVAARIQASVSTPFYPRDDQRYVFDLPNGRCIDYSVFGASDGQPLIFYHCQAFGDVWFKDAVDAARMAGFTIIAPLRPGFGHTTLYEGESSEPRVFAPDVEALLDHLGVERAPLISVSSGFVHGLALAERMPRRIASIIATHPLLPVLTDDDLEGTNGYNYLIPHTRLHFPQAVRFLCKAGFAFVTSAGPAAFGKAVMRASPKDVEWISRPDILPVMEQGRQIHRHQGYVGNYGDISYRGDWCDLLQDTGVSVRLVIGENDRNVQWKAAREWSSTLDHVNLHVMPDSGYMVHHQHYSQIIRWAKADLNR